MKETRICWAWDVCKQKHIEVPGFNVTRKCPVCGMQYVTADDSDWKHCEQA